MFESLIKLNDNKLDDEFIEHLIQLYNNYISMNLDTFDAKLIIHLKKFSSRKQAYKQLEQNLNCSTLKCVLSKDFIKYSEKFQIYF